jgi:phosphoglycolate phosphatase-like HAD superfamily hydrolase
VLVGDSLLDMEVAADAGVHRVFVSHWTEFADWYRYVETNGDILVVEDLAELLEVLTRRRPLPDRPGLDWVPSIA